MRMITALIGINDPDISFHYMDNLIWWIVEMNFGIICACLPCLKALLKHYFPNLAFFDPNLEHRVLTSFRLSNRMAHFGARSADDDCAVDNSGQSLGSEKTGVDSRELRTKPSVGSESTV